MLYDIVVVGAGPAGSSAAGEAAKLGAKVLLIEKRKIIGQPVQCAEFIPRLLCSEVEISTRSIVQEITMMNIHLPNGECVQSSSPGYMLDRMIFDKELVVAAIHNGADISINTTCVSKRNNTIRVKKEGKQMEITAKIIIGADGPTSTVGKWIDAANKEFVLTVQYELPLKKQIDYTEIFFDSNYFGGYAWLFPKKNTANVGIGIKHRAGSTVMIENLLKVFAHSLEKENKVKATPLSMTHGLIPVGGPNRTIKDNIILVGDAAGQTHPITGAGIPQAIICGKIAGNVAVHSLTKTKKKQLNAYDEQWRALFEEELNRALAKRKVLESQWDDLSNIIRRCWVTFPHYYE
jgi:digeranylgeranylglycerophospholipid reductase